MYNASYLKGRSATAFVYCKTIFARSTSVSTNFTQLPLSNWTASNACIIDIFQQTTVTTKSFYSQEPPCWAGTRSVITFINIISTSYILLSSPFLQLVHQMCWSANIKSFYHNFLPSLLRSTSNCDQHLLAYNSYTVSTNHLSTWTGTTLTCSVTSHPLGSVGLKV